jgi:AraC-like DNA-binding protein
MFSFTYNDIIYTIAIPVYPVNIIVDHFVFMKGNGSQTPERLFPNNQTEMFFNLGDRVLGKNNWYDSTPQIKDNIISGVRNKFFDFYPPKNFKMAGMRFTLFGYSQLFKEPAHHFTDHNFSANDVFGKEIELLHERLFEAQGPRGIFSILNNWISKRLSECSSQEVKKWNKLGKRFEKQNGSVSDLIKKYMGYSHKHSIVLIKQHAGLNPKKIKTIYRFSKALKEISTIKVESWAGFADKHNYADQSHFIRDFKKYSGYTPSEYLKMKPRKFHLNKARQEDLSDR